MPPRGLIGRGIVRNCGMRSNAPNHGRMPGLPVSTSWLSPHELNVEQRIKLARGFGQEISDRYRNVVDLALHTPRTDERNFHAHLLSTTREVLTSGFGRKIEAELSGSQRFELGLPRAMEEHSQIRERWAFLANGALREAGLAISISHNPDPRVLLQSNARAWAAEGVLGNRAPRRAQYCGRSGPRRICPTAGGGAGAVPFAGTGSGP